MICNISNCVESIWGLLVGTAVTGSFAYAYLLDSQRGSSEALVSSMGHLQASVESVKKSLSKVESLEESLAQLQLDAATKVDLERRRRELLKEIVNNPFCSSTPCRFFG